MQKYVPVLLVDSKKESTVSGTEEDDWVSAIQGDTSSFSLLIVRY